MKNSRYFFSFRSLVILGLATVLYGCSLGKNYRDINPEVAQKDERASNGYNFLRTVPPGKANIVFRSEGMPYRVGFSMSNSTAACQGFNAIGDVMDAGHGVVYPWIAKLSGKMTRTKSFIGKNVAPSQSIQIRGYGLWVLDTQLVVETGDCGPIISTFTPQEGHAYLVRFIWNGTSCKQVVSDATNPDSPVDLDIEGSLGCSKS